MAAKWMLSYGTSFQDIGSKLIRNLRESFPNTNQMMRIVMNSNIERESPEIPKGRERFARISVRVNQGFFRSSVLAAYNNQCCITGLKQPELLVASHIKSWREDKDNRLNPRNGLCLNALHDKAFDRGLLGIDENFRIIFSPLLSKAEGFDDLFKPYENRMIRLPERLNPSLEFLKFHRENIFQS